MITSTKAYLSFFILSLAALQVQAQDVEWIVSLSPTYAHRFLSVDDSDLDEQMAARFEESMNNAEGGIFAYEGGIGVRLKIMERWKLGPDSTLAEKALQTLRC